MAETTAPPAPRWARFLRAVPADSWVARAIHVFVLAAVAIAQPLWSLLVENVEFLVNRRSDRVEILAVAALLLLVPPGVVMVVETLAGLVSRRLVTVLHALAVGGFALLIFLRVLVRLAGGNTLVVLGVGLLGAVGAFAYYATTTGARRALTLAGPAPVLFLVMFLLNADVKPLVFPTARSQGITVSFTQRPPVVFLVFDEFPLRGILTPELEIDQQRAPSFARFAKDATWHRRATTVHEVSEMAVPAILTGIRSPQKQVPTADNFPVNLFSVFTGGGYDVRAAESLTRLCTPDTCHDTPELPPLKLRVRSHLKDLGVVYGHQVLPRAVAQRTLPDIGLTWGNFGATDPAPGGNGGTGGNGGVGRAGVRTDISKAQEPRLEDFLRGLRPSAQPTLHYLHVLMPHAPFDRLPNGKRYTKGSSFIGINLKTGYFDDDEFATDQAEQRNMLQVGYTDRQFGRILDTLQQSGLYDDALVVVASDHGSTNRPKLNRRAFDVESLGDLGPVPLFFKLPKQRAGKVVDDDAQTIDILPTVADALGFEIPGAVTGLSLLQPHAPRERQFVDQFGNVMTGTPEFPQLAESVRDMYARFAVVDGRLNVFAMGPYKALVGRRGAGLPTRPGRRSAKLDTPEYWTTGAPAGFSPAHQTGTVEGRPAGSPPGSPVHLAVAVGDTVVATARSFDVSGDTARLDVLVPDEHLQPGHPPVRLFAVSGEPGRPELTPVPFG